MLSRNFNLDEFKIELNKMVDKEAAKGNILPPVSDEEILQNTGIQEMFALCQHGPVPTFEGCYEKFDVTLEKLKEINMNPATRDHLDAANSAQRINENMNKILSEFIAPDMSTENEAEKEQEKPTKKEKPSWFGVNSWFGSSSKRTSATPVKSNPIDEDFGFEELSQPPRKNI